MERMTKSNLISSAIDQLEARLHSLECATDDTTPLEQRAEEIQALRHHLWAAYRALGMAADQNLSKKQLIGKGLDKT